LAELVVAFRSDCPSLLAEIEASIGENKPGDLCRAAHTLKSMLRFFEATAASEAAFQLEKMGQNCDLAGSPEIFARLSTEVERLEFEFARLAEIERR
jgi:HPt (histidine-containing phosphotransfer) domain-containing protein